jgi:polyribonucleotide nucleotidyltransferase
MNNIVRKEIEFAGRKLVLETGELAMRAPIAVKATYGDTVVLVTITHAPSAGDIDFLDLRVEYQEKFYASGSINSSRFIKREGKPTDDAVISRRVIDHAFRPLFPKDFNLSVQIAATVLSLDEDADAEFLTMVATSAALFASELPAAGPVVTARVGLIHNNYVLCPSRSDLHEVSDMEMMVSFVGDDKRFLAVEAGLKVLPEEKVLGAINYARDGLDPIMNLIKEFALAVNPEKKVISYKPKEYNQTLVDALKANYKEQLTSLIKSSLDKLERDAKLVALKKQAVDTYGEEYGASTVMEVLGKYEKEAIRSLALQDNKRLDGRNLTEVRPITTKVDVLPRTHGSGLFTRGTTQALTIATLGSPSSELMQQDMYGERTKRFMHFYNFPPYSTGEIGRFGTPGGREIGHGMIAEKALRAVMPSQEEFPYTVILTSEILSSNGSSSMAASCGATLALMSAGVPIKDMVGGVAMGLIVEDESTFDNFRVLTDLSGEEDFAGYLDFKMTGTREGVTAIQCDMKVKGLPMNVLDEVIIQSRAGRLHVLDEMSKTITTPNSSLSKYAPRMSRIKIDPDKIGTLIGSGGKTIKEIQDTTQTEIHIEDDGTVIISGKSEELMSKALAWVDGLTRDVKPGEIYDGKVVDLLDFGALTEILPGKVGLLHISELSNEYVSNIRDVIRVGDLVRVKVLRVEDNGKIALSKKAVKE